MHVDRWREGDPVGKDDPCGNSRQVGEPFDPAASKENAALSCSCEMLPPLLRPSEARFISGFPRSRTLLLERLAEFTGTVISRMPATKRDRQDGRATSKYD